MWLRSTALSSPVILLGDFNGHSLIPEELYVLVGSDVESSEEKSEANDSLALFLLLSSLRWDKAARDLERLSI
jgi:hypothetical protein